MNDEHVGRTDDARRFAAQLLFVRPGPWRRAASLAALFVVLSLHACDGRGERLRSPTAPQPDPEPTPAPTFDATFSADHSLRIDTFSAACGWPPAPDSVAWPYWHVLVYEDSIRFEDDADPFSTVTFEGSLTGGEFVTKADRLDAPDACLPFPSQGWLSGRFAEDLGSFEAYLTWVYGTVEDPKTIEWRVSARRDPN